LFKISKETCWQYSGIGVFKFEKFRHLPFSTIFTVYNLNNSNFIYKNCSPIQIKHFGQYSKGIGLLQFENFHI